MINFSLCCENAHEFDGWFRNSAAFDAQVEAGELLCPVCSSAQISKALMAPNVTPKSNRAGAGGGGPQKLVGSPDPATAAAIEQIRTLKQKLVESSEYVGDKFADEARKIHYEETEKRGIHGEASIEDAQALHEEGVEVFALPSLPEDKN
jgi:hypothetical protein